MKSNHTTTRILETGDVKVIGDVSQFNDLLKNNLLVIIFFNDHHSVVEKLKVSRIQDVFRLGNFSIENHFVFIILVNGIKCRSFAFELTNLFNPRIH